MKIKLSLFLLIFALSSAIAFSEETNSCAKEFIITGWIPYWRKFQGCEAVKSKLNFFNELSPFAFEVKTDGSLIDTLRINEPPWIDLLPNAKENEILILPSILWTDSKAIHAILNSASARKQHIREIINLIETKNFDGIDIDYEGKDASDKDIFSVFITELSYALKTKGYYLSCTIEARTADYPPSGWQQIRAIAWANDFSVLNKYCDEIRIMAYDQPFQAKGAKEWQDNLGYPYVPNADILWVEEVIKYTLQKIAPEKIVLGIPTYGWEYIIKGTSKNWSYKRFKSITYPQAIESANSYSIIPKRDNSGELSFIYQKESESYLDYFPDSESIRQKIQLAKKYKLGGIVFFKLDGLEDKKMWEVLKKETADKQERFLIATEAVADVRREPIDAAAGNAHDDLQETQVLYNEPLIYRGENEGWYLVEAVEQQEFSHHQTWEGYPGWVRKNSVKLINKIPQYNFIVKNKAAEVLSKPAAEAKVLFIVSIGTQFEVVDDKDEFYKVNLADKRIGWLKKKDLNKIETIDKDIVRGEIIAAAEKFLGTPYLWGGRSMYLPKIKTTATGVDCSGLTSIAYRANNISIPRDAHEQWMAAKRISSDELKPGDFIFISAKDNPIKIVHVMLYIDGERFIESSGTGNVVSIRTFEDKIGINLAELIKRDFLIDGKKIYFGRIEF